MEVAHAVTVKGEKREGGSKGIWEKTGDPGATVKRKSKGNSALCPSFISLFFLSFMRLPAFHFFPLNYFPCPLSHPLSLLYPPLFPLSPFTSPFTFLHLPFHFSPPLFPLSPLTFPFHFSFTSLPLLFLPLLPLSPFTSLHFPFHFFLLPHFPYPLSFIHSLP